MMRAALPLALLLVAACADEGVPGVGADIAADSAADADADSATDSDADAAADADADSAADAGADSATDSDADAATDSDADADADPELPPEIVLTVNGLGPRYDGSLPYVQDGDTKTYEVWVNRADFTLDVLVDPKAGPVDPGSLDVACDAALLLPGGATVGAGEAIPSDAFDPVDHGFRVHFLGDSGLSDGQSVGCGADVAGPGGASSGSVSFIAATLPPGLDPFVTPDVWLVVLSRDIFSVTVTPAADGTYTVVSDHVPAGDGAPDFAQPFYEIGLMSEAAPAVAAAFEARLKQRIREVTHQMFGLDAAGSPLPEGVPLQLFWEGDAGAPDPSTWSEGAGFSMIALGGDGKPEDQTNGIVGRAAVDWNNQGVEDNTIYGRGVFPTAMVRSVISQPIGVFALQEFLPGVGTPLGEHPGDELLFDPDFDPDTASQDLYTRWQLLDLAIEMLGRALASTLCHEIGHSLGLVPHGPPPHGLFADMPGLDFVDNFVPGAHVDTPGLNIMQTGAVTNWAEAVDQIARFNALNMAYLRRRIVVLGDLNPP